MSIRGRVLTGTIVKMKMKNTVVIRRDYLHYIKKYNRFEKRHKNMSVHMSPCFRDVQVGDVVTVGECRPLSKTVKFNTLKVTKAQGNKKVFKMSESSKLFVYGVNENCPREVLENEFGRCGEVTDVYNTGKGYAFVTMIDENAAQAAIRDLNGVSIDGGKPIKVSKSIKTLSLKLKLKPVAYSYSL